VIDTPQLSSSPHAGLDLVRYEQRPVSGTELSGAGEKIGGWNDAACFSLNGLQHHARDADPDGFAAAKLALQGIGIAVGDEADVLQAGLERLPE
jgi:hypothetical protein